MLCSIYTMLAAAGCAVSGDRTSDTAATTDWVLTRLYFGMSISEGGHVTAEQWQVFVDDVVTPRFPDGWTQLDASGQYRMTNGRIIREPTKVLLILHQPTNDTNRRMGELIDIYKQRHQQESVLRVDSDVNASF